jgi:hypothetical protein
LDKPVVKQGLGINERLKVITTESNREWLIKQVTYYGNSRVYDDWIDLVVNPRFNPKWVKGKLENMEEHDEPTLVTMQIHRKG